MATARILAKLPRMQLPEKLKGTIVEKWANYWTGLARDYTDVAIESVKKIRAKPVKSSIYGTIGAVLYGSALTNPDHNTFIDQFRAHENEVSLVAFESQSKKTTEYLKYLEQCKNNDVLRILSLGAVSLMWVDDHSSTLSTYDAVCEYLEPEYLTFNKRVIDIGFWGRWWNMENNIVDFDINY